MTCTVGELCTRLGWTMLCGDATRVVEDAYACDMLSWVMSRAKAGGAWITILNSMNVIAVGLLADVACVVLSEGTILEDDVLTRAREKGVTVLSAPEDTCRVVLSLRAVGVV